MAESGRRAGRPSAAEAQGRARAATAAQRVEKRCMDVPSAEL